MSFAVVRHPDIAALGICPEAVLDAHRANGWFRVSPWAAAPVDLHLPEYADSYVDLDAEPESPKPEATKKTKSEIKEQAS